MSDIKKKKRAGLLEIFSVFSKIGALTIGGGYAMIPLVQNEISKRGWLSEKELPDIVALAQSAPGVLAVNMAIFAGHRIRGVAGSIAATIGTCIPPFLIILLIATLFSGYQDNPLVVRIFKGIRPVVIALIAVPMINMAKKNNKSWAAWGISIATLILVAFLKVSPIYILLVIMVFAFTYTYIKEKRNIKE